MIKSGNKEADTILIFVVLAAVVYLVYKITKTLGAGVGAVEDVITDPFGTGAANAELQAQIQIDESKLTYPKYQYTTWADAIETAILGDVNEDEQAVDAIIWQIQNDEDLAQLIKAFGVRKDWYFGAIPGGEYTLPGAISHFLPERINDYNYHFGGWGMKSRF